MKAFGLWFLFLVFGTALIPGHGGPSRKVKENYEGVNLLDYHRNDPAPSSKASINHGPIQHGIPLMPYIPKPPPPEPNYDDHVDVVFP